MRAYTSPNRGIETWRIGWIMHGRSNGSSPRSRLASELDYIRKAHGAGEAIAYRDNLHWLGAYPVRLEVQHG